MTGTLRRDGEKGGGVEEGGGGRQEQGCVARPDYAYSRAGFLDAVFVLEAGGSRQMLQMKEVLLCVDFVDKIIPDDMRLLF